MARGEMVRFMAENQIAEAEELKLLDHPRYIFEEGLSSEKEYVFVRKNS